MARLSSMAGMACMHIIIEYNYLFNVNPFFSLTTCTCRVLNFVEAVEVVNVALYGCRPPSLIIPLPPPPPPLPPPPSIRPETAIGLNGSDASFIALVVTEENVLRGYVATASAKYITSGWGVSLHIDSNHVN